MRIHTNKSGVTLIELMIASFLSLIIVGMLVYLSNHQRKLYIKQQAIVEAQEKVNRVHAILVDRIRMAGYMIPDTTGIFAIVPFFVSHAQRSDSIRITGNFDNFIMSAIFAVNAGSKIVYTRFSDNFKWQRGMRILLRMPGADSIITFTSVLDTAYAFSFMGTNYIFFSMASATPRTFPVNSSVSTFNSFTYQVFREQTTDRNYFGVRINNQSTLHNLVDGIEQLRLTYATKGDTTLRNTLPTDSLRHIYLVNIQVTARSATKDFNYIDPVRGDNFRRATLSSRVVVLNNVLKKL